MSANVSINLHQGDPKAYVLTIASSGQRFITFEIAPQVCFYLHGFDAQAVVSARSIAACLTAVADDLERSLAADPPAAVEAPIDVFPIPEGTAREDEEVFF